MDFCDYLYQKVKKLKQDSNNGQIMRPVSADAGGGKETKVTNQMFCFMFICMTFGRVNIMFCNFPHLTLFVI